MIIMKANLNWYVDAGLDDPECLLGFKL
jgi:hypothetical protein